MKQGKPNIAPPHFAHLCDKFVTIVALGDSITADTHFTYGFLNYVGLLKMGLDDVFPEGVTMINSGISGDRLTCGLARLDRDVLRFEPDIVIVAYGMNDVRDTPLPQFRQELGEVVRRIRAAGDAKIVFRTPNPMVNTLTGLELNEFPGPDGRPVPTDLAAYSAAICEAAAKYDTLLVDHYTSWKRSMESSCRGDLLMLMGNPQHPNHLGHRRIYHELAPLFNSFRNFYFEWERILNDQNRLELPTPGRL